MDHGCSSDELLRRLDALDRRTQELATLVAQKDALIAEQKALIAIQQEQLAAQQVALDRAREQLALFKKAMFGPRREASSKSLDSETSEKTILYLIRQLFWQRVTAYTAPATKRSG